LPDSLRPPEPLAQQRGDGRRHQRPDDQCVEEQAEADGGADLADDGQLADGHRHHREGEVLPDTRRVRLRRKSAVSSAGMSEGL
jgi:hypothetical protein